MRIVAFGTYQGASHPRIIVLIEGLRALGHDVIEINEPLGLSTADRVSMLRAPWRLPLLAVRLAKRWTALIRKARRQLRGERPDAILVGYLGHFDVHLAKRVFRGIPIILDHLIFAAGTAQDRGMRTGLTTKALHGLDNRALAAADVIVLDSEEHRARVPAALRPRTIVCPVGADNRWFVAGQDAAPTPLTVADGPVRVVYFGLYVPLHGATVIGAALRLLTEQGFTEHELSVTMIGSGQEQAATKQAAGQAPMVSWLDWVQGDELPTTVAAHHISLGIFGTTTKSAEVIPNKIYQSAAARCALITADTAPQRRTLGNSATLIPAGEPAALAAAIADLVRDRQRLSELRRRAADLSVRDFSAATVARPLHDRLTTAVTA